MDKLTYTDLMDLLLGILLCKQCELIHLKITLVSVFYFFFWITASASEREDETTAARWVAERVAGKQGKCYFKI